MNAFPIDSPRGAHVMLDITGFTPTLEKGGGWMLERMEAAVSASGARMVHSHVEDFDGSISPPGFAAVVLIDESHVSAHCYSEQGLLAIDAFTCGTTKPEVIIDHLLNSLQSAVPELVVENRANSARFLPPNGSENENDTELSNQGGVGNLIKTHYRHFNAGVLADASQSLSAFLADGGQLVLTLAGAMSTAEIGRSLAPMIRAGKIAAICTTGANLEEDLFNLVAHDHYHRIPDWRGLNPAQEAELAERGMNRVTDTCIPEEMAIRKLEPHLVNAWKQASDTSGEEGRKFPHEFLCSLFEGPLGEGDFQAKVEDTWLLAAHQNHIPIFTPGWEDSTLGNIFAAHCLSGEVKASCVKSGVEAMMELANWYKAQTGPVGLLQVGGGIAGDFPICVVPMLRQDMGENVDLWAWFCQISEATASYGGYSGAPPDEKISWGKLGVDTPRFVIESDATIVLPLMFAAVLGW